jgi:hypothetical protein
VAVITVEQMRALALDWQQRLDETRPGATHDQHAELGADVDTVAEYRGRLEQALETLDAMISRAGVAGSLAGPWATWRSEHFRPGDDALILGCWYPVIRVNRWSLTVAPLVLLGQRRLDQRGRDEHSDIVCFDAVCGRRRGGYGVPHPLQAGEGICTELLQLPAAGREPAPQAICGQAPAARLTLHHDGTFCGCDWFCRLDRYVTDRPLPPWTERRLLCHRHLTENHRRDPALHQPPARVLELLPPPGGEPPPAGGQAHARHTETPPTTEPWEGDQW